MRCVTTVANAAYKRKHPRYFVTGTAKIQWKDHPVLGRLLVVGGGGLLVYCDLNAPIDEEVTVRFSVFGLSEVQTINARGKIAWSQPGKVGVEFLEEPPGLRRLMQLLEIKGDVDKLNKRLRSEAPQCDEVGSP
jgi:hypothetical protein